MSSLSGGYVGLDGMITQDFYTVKIGQAPRSVEPATKRIRMTSSLSDSGHSSMSSQSYTPLGTPITVEQVRTTWPSLVVLTKPDDITVNSYRRTRFPDPVQDRSVLFACFASNQTMLHMRHIVRPGSVSADSNIFKKRLSALVPESGIQSDDESSTYFLSLDSVHRNATDDDIDSACKPLSNFIMLTEVREHAVAGKCLPDGVCGYWVRVFGAKTSFTLGVSLWTSCKHDKPEAHRKQVRKELGNDRLTKIGEVSVVLQNSGPNGGPVKKKKAKLISGLQVGLREQRLRSSCNLPTFCSKETYIQISMCLSECRENGKYDLFEEMYAKFNVRTDEENEEQQLFLWLERSLCLAVQGKFPEAKHLLQEIVEGIPRSANKLFLLNRAYLNLAGHHIMEGNYGTAEECLMMLQDDSKNGMFCEDVGNYYLAKATILLRFGKNLPRMSHLLWCESSSAFEEALISFNKSLPLLFNQLCRAHVNMAILGMYRIQAKKEFDVSDFDPVFERVKIVEQFGMHKLSERVKCLLLILKGELYHLVGRPAEGSNFLLEAERMSRDLRFAEEKRLSEKAQAIWAESQYNQFIEQIKNGDEKDQDLADLDEVNMGYRGDISSS